MSPNDPEPTQRGTEILQCSSLGFGGAPNQIQNISGFPQGLTQQFGGTLIVR